MNKILFTLPSMSLHASKMPRILKICQQLDRSKYQPIVSVDHKGRLNEQAQIILKSMNIPLRILRMSPHPSYPVRSSLDLFSTITELREMKISIQHSSDYSQAWSEPIVARLGNVGHWIVTKTNSEVSGFNWIVKLSLAEKIIVQSPKMRDLLLRNNPNFDKKIVIIPNGVDVSVFCPKKSQNLTEDKLGISDSFLTLGCVAHLVSVKNHLALLEALRQSENYKRIMLLIIGKTIDEGYELKIKEKVATLGMEGNVKFLGERKDLPKLYGLMDGIVLTSLGESLSNAILEGMACGLPVISSNVGGMSDIVRPNFNGWLVDLDEDFIHNLQISIDDWADSPNKREKFGDNSTKIIEEGYTINKMVNEHISLYDSLLA